MDPWQALPVLSSFPTEQDIFHFTFPQENVDSRQKKKKKKKRDCCFYCYLLSVLPSGSLEALQAGVYSPLSNDWNEGTMPAETNIRPDRS